LPALVAVLAYLLGSVPFGLILTRAAGLGDVRAIGSGNIGATNVLRTGNKGLAAATLLLDAGKGVAQSCWSASSSPSGWSCSSRSPPAPSSSAIATRLAQFKGREGRRHLLRRRLRLWWPIGPDRRRHVDRRMAITRSSSGGGTGRRQ
jgi:glycerol-3-phosphate acyltransferase PlsY